jgi:hypothetical protein
MTHTGRRLQQGARALGIALNASRAEESLYRCMAGRLLDAADRVHLTRMANLCQDARQGYEWFERARRNEQAVLSAGTSVHLRALGLLSAAQQADAGGSPAALLDRLARSLGRIARGETVDAAELQFVREVLSRVAARATAEGREILEPEPAAALFTARP